MLWLDKYKPKSIDKLNYHIELSKRLQIMVNIL